MNNEHDTAPKREVEWKRANKLRLDSLNPRLPEGFENANQSALLQVLARDYDLQDIGHSLASNGYFAEEPLVTIKSKNEDAWVVVEGNRRLAALLLLGDPSRAPKSLRPAWEELSKKRRFKILEVPILEYDRREEITPYLGFRHITGVLEWRPYQKGRYIAQLVEKSKKSFFEIARIIGSKAPTVREHYVGYTLLRQARDAFAIDTQRVQESFGVLRRALSDPSIRAFIKLQLDQSEKYLAHPLPKSAAANTRELLLWMFGDEQTEPALKDSRRLSDLGMVLNSEVACGVLRNTNNLDYAFEMAGGEERRLLESLNKASYFLDQVLPMALRHKKSKDVRDAVQRCNETFKEVLRIFRME